MTNIRAAVNNMTDEELTKALSPIFTIIDGKLRDCDGVGCITQCPHVNCPGGIDDFSCRKGIERFMMEEVASE